MPTVERIEHRDAVGAGDDRLAVQRERLGTQLGGGRRDRRISIGPVIAAPGEQVHLTIDFRRWPPIWYADRWL